MVDEEEDDDELKHAGMFSLMRRAGLEITRENFILANWGHPTPEWTAELEAELPERLQDWSLYEMVDGELELKPDAFPNKQ